MMFLINQFFLIKNEVVKNLIDTNIVKRQV